MIQLEDWSVQSDGDDFVAPELKTKYLIGAAVDHPRFPNGRRVATTRIVHAVGRIARTQSGSVYKLGKPDEKWLEWLRKHKLPFDPENPIKVK
jgi:hypothetical protein